MFRIALLSLHTFGWYNNLFVSIMMRALLKPLFLYWEPAVHRAASGAATHPADHSGCVLAQRWSTLCQHTTNCKDPHSNAFSTCPFLCLSLNGRSYWDFGVLIFSCCSPFLWSDVSHGLPQLFWSSHSVRQETPHCCIIHPLLLRQGNRMSRPPLWCKKGERLTPLTSAVTCAFADSVIFKLNTGIINETVQVCGWGRYIEERGGDFCG